MTLSKKCTFLAKRFVSNDLRVRFAPSPTGMLHLGGLRTALYNYMFACKNNGQMILRIEDTDQVRIVSRAVEKLTEMLQWAGIYLDESPFVGGEHSPYIQSLRKELYERKANDLLEAGSAYRCFCSKLRLAALKKKYQKLGKNPQYDNKCRNLSTQGIQEKLKNNESFVIRFKLGSSMYNLEDMVYGSVFQNVAVQESDPVIMKADGFPTYHFASVIDDHHMNITHVLRGNEWLSSTMKHLQIYEAFKWTPPKFGHFPLALKSDGKKFSKRDEHLHIQSLKERGYSAEALINFITESSGGFNDRDYNLLYSLTQLTDMFDIQKLRTNSVYFDFTKLDTMNQLWIKKQLSNLYGSAKFVENLKAQVVEKFPEFVVSDKDDDYYLQILDFAKDYIHTINELVGEEYKFLWDSPVVDQIEVNKLSENTVLILQSLVKKLQPLTNEDFKKDRILKVLEDTSKEYDIKLSVLRKILRHCISGVKFGPQIPEMLQLLGKFGSIKRLNFVKETLMKS